VKQILFFLPVFFLLFFSCVDDDNPAQPIDEAFDYVPLTEGSWYEYALDSVIYNDFDNTVVTRQYDLRVEIGDSFQQNGETVTRMLRYLKPRGSAQEFELETVWFGLIKNNRFETFEENLHFIKFLFPPIEGTTWDGNTFIQGEGNDNPTTSTLYLEGWEYEVISANQPETIQGETFSNVTKVMQVDQPGGAGAIQHLVAEEWYARDVGLIKKRMELVVENCGAPGCSEKELPVLDRTNLRKGYTLNLEIVDYQIQ